MRGDALTRAFPGGIVIRRKSKNVGLQPADLVVTPIGKHVLGKPGQRDWEVVEKHFRRNRMGEYLGYGLKIFP